MSSEIIEQKQQKQKVKTLEKDIPMKKYRSQTDIIASILKCISENTSYNPRTKRVIGLSSTGIMYRSFLSYAQLKYYIALLRASDLLYTPTENVLEFAVTEKGLKYLKIAKELQELIGQKI